MIKQFRTENIFKHDYERKHVEWPSMATETGVAVNRRKSLLGLGSAQQETTKLDKSLLDVINLKITKIEWNYDGNQIVALRITLNDSMQSPIFGNSKSKLVD